MAEDAARRKSATQFSSENQPGNDGGANFAPPSNGPLGKAREQAAAMIPGGASHTTLEKIGYLEDIANNPTQPETMRAEAAAGLERIEAGDPVHPIYQAIRDADSTARERCEAELHARAEAAVAQAKSIKKGKRTPPRPLPLVTDDGQPVRYPLRAFIQTWGELTDWWTPTIRRARSSAGTAVSSSSSTPSTARPSRPLTRTCGRAASTSVPVTA
jgi:ParB family chromosome partitioning protein